MSNKRIILWTIIICLSLIIGMSYYKINKERHDATYKVINKRIIESANLCFKDNLCQKNMTLGELIAKGYIEQIVDPDTKQYYSSSSTIRFDGKQFVFTPSY